MKYLETKHERKAATITVLLMSILILLLFVVGQDYKDPPEEYGVALNLDSASAPMPVSKSQNATPSQVTKTQTEQEKQQVIEEDVVEENTLEEQSVEAQQQEASEIKKQQEDLLAQQQEDALKIQSEKAAKAKAESDAKAKAEEALKEAKEKADAEAKADSEKKNIEAAKRAKAAEAKAKAEADAKAAAAKKAAAEKAAAAANAKRAAENNGGKAISFSLIEEFPIYPGCEGVPNSARRECMNTELKKFLGENFNKELPSELGLEGTQTIQIFFNINTKGQVVSIRAKAARPELEAEAKRVSGLLPKMKPGMQQGQPATVKYYLPIKIQSGN